MEQRRTVSFFVAVLIIINLVIGSGIFINLIPFLTQGYTGNFLIYLLGGLIQLPVVITLARLASAHPDNGGLYVYAKRYISPFAGFLAGWTYFVGKSISVGLMAHVFMQVMQSFIPALHVFPLLFLDACFLTFVVLANVLGVSIQGKAQKVLILTKVLPVVTVFLILWWKGGQRPLTFDGIGLHSVGELLPIAVFATVGFEVMCSIAHMVKNPKENLVKIMVTGFGVVVALITLFQCVVNLLLPQAASYSFPLGSIAHLHGLSALAPYAYICVYLSIIGGAFSILTTNCWNLFALAENGHLPGACYITKLTKEEIPWVSLVIEAVIAFLGISMMQEQVALQRMAVFGMVLSFVCASLAALRARRHAAAIVSPVVASLALLSSGGLALWILKGIYEVGISLPYLCIYFVGVLLAIYQARAAKNKRLC